MALGVARHFRTARCLGCGTWCDRLQVLQAGTAGQRPRDGRRGNGETGQRYQEYDGPGYTAEDHQADAAAHQRRSHHRAWRPVEVGGHGAGVW